MSEKRVAVAMSGGVDSSVAAALLLEKGFRVAGVMMKIWGGGETPTVRKRNSCYSPFEEENIGNARKVADILGIPLHVIDLTQEFRREVLDYLSREYLSGRTPNPCMKCNSRLKFAALLEKAENSGIGFDLFATGHYSRVEYSNSAGRYLLRKGKDVKKDQSYFLAFLSQAQLSRTIFPVGQYTKQEVTELARRYKLGIDEKPESQDFVAAGYRSITGESKPGTIINGQGEVLGSHRGISGYTIGQRRGLGISGKEPIYVTDIDPETHVITVGSGEELYGDELTASGLNWISIDIPESGMEVRAKIRYSHREAEATVTPVNRDTVRVRFRKPQMAITPGQAVVFYRDDVVVGGGTIERSRDGRIP